MAARTGIIEIEVLMKALINKIGLKKDVAQDVARRVLNYFGFGTHIIDNLLNQEDRRLFYFLQDSGMLGTDWDETFLPNGRGWRIFYWRLNVHNIKKYAALEEVEDEEKIQLYDSLPDNAWCREEAT